MRMIHHRRRMRPITPAMQLAEGKLHDEHGRDLGPLPGQRWSFNACRDRHPARLGGGAIRPGPAGHQMSIDPGSGDHREPRSKIIMPAAAAHCVRAAIVQTTAALRSRAGPRPLAKSAAARSRAGVAWRRPEKPRPPAADAARPVDREPWAAGLGLEPGAGTRGIGNQRSEAGEFPPGPRGRLLGASRGLRVSAGLLLLSLIRLRGNRKR